MKFKAPIGTVLASAALLNVLPADKMEAADFFSKPIAPGIQGDRLQAGLPGGVRGEHDVLGRRAESAIDHLPHHPGDGRANHLDRHGEIDLTWTIPPDQLPKLKQNTNLTVAPTPSYTYYFSG